MALAAGVVADEAADAGPVVGEAGGAVAAGPWCASWDVGGEVGFGCAGHQPGPMTLPRGGFPEATRCASEPVAMPVIRWWRFWQ